MNYKITQVLLIPVKRFSRVYHDLPGSAIGNQGLPCMNQGLPGSFIGNQDLSEFAIGNQSFDDEFRLFPIILKETNSILSLYLQSTRKSYSLGNSNQLEHFVGNFFIYFGEDIQL
jgi:hypothetical protein